MFGRKLKNQISKLKAQITLLTIDKEAIEKASEEMAAKYRDDLVRLDKVKAENAELKKQVEELKLKISRKDQKRGTDGRFAKKNLERYNPKDGDIIAVEFYQGSKLSRVAGILKGYVSECYESGMFRMYAGINAVNKLSIDEFGFGFLPDKPIRPATKVEKKMLFAALKEKGLEWNPETKTLDKIKVK